MPLLENIHKKSTEYITDPNYVYLIITADCSLHVEYMNHFPTS